MSVEVKQDEWYPEKVAVTQWEGNHGTTSRFSIEELRELADKIQPFLQAVEDSEWEYSLQFQHGGVSAVRYTTQEQASEWLPAGQYAEWAVQSNTYTAIVRRKAGTDDEWEPVP